MTCLICKKCRNEITHKDMYQLGHTRYKQPKKYQFYKINFKHFRDKFYVIHPDILLNQLQLKFRIDLPNIGNVIIDVDKSIKSNIYVINEIESLDLILSNVDMFKHILNLSDKEILDIIHKAISIKITEIFKENQILAKKYSNLVNRYYGIEKKYDSYCRNFSNKFGIYRLKEIIESYYEQNNR